MGPIDTRSKNQAILYDGSGMVKGFSEELKTATQTMFQLLWWPLNDFIIFQILSYQDNMMGPVLYTTIKNKHILYKLQNLIYYLNTVSIFMSWHIYQKTWQVGVKSFFFITKSNDVLLIQIGSVS